MPRGEGSFAALLRNRRDQVFGDDYDHSGEAGDGNGATSATSNWRTRPLPLVARVNLVRIVLRGVIYTVGSIWLTYLSPKPFGDTYRHHLAPRVPLQGTANIGIPSRGCSTAMEACIRRVWLEHPPLSAKALEELKISLAEWEAWKQSRVEQVGYINHRSQYVLQKHRGRRVWFGWQDRVHEPKCAP